MELNVCKVAPKDWTRKSIVKICERVTSGGTPSRQNKSFYKDADICWVKTKELEDGFIKTTEEKITKEAIENSSAKLLPKNTILLAMYGATVGKLGILDKEMACNQACCALIVGEDYDRDFLFYQLLFHREQLISSATGAAQQNLSATQIKDFVLPFPTKSLQVKIGNILRSLDDRIDLLKQTNQTLESIAQAIFKSWFVDFDPVHARQQGIKCAGIDDATAELFPDSFVESELGLIPKGWEVKTVGKIFLLTMGQSPAGNTYNENGDGIEFYQGRTDFGFRFPSQRVFCNAPTRIAHENDILISVRAPVGDINVALSECCIGRGVAAIKHPKSFQSYALYSMKQLSSKFQVYDGEGTVFGSINKTDFENIKLIAPNEKVVEAFEKIIGTFDKKIKNNEHLLRNLVLLRDTLLPRLISGKLDLSEIKEQLEGVV